MASFTVPCPKCVSPLHLGLNSQNPQLSKQILSFRNGLNLKPPQLFRSSFAGPSLPGFQCLNRKQFSAGKFQAQLNEEKDDHNGQLSGPSTSVDASSITAFMTQVSDLVKLVDSRDISELQLKQSDCELMIRKKEALQPPPATAVAPVPPPVPYHTLPSPPPAPVSASALASPPPSKAAPVVRSAGKPSTSSHPPLKCPMAGTIYRSSAPGEPPFVKVGDRVQKGQVVCIIEAMKLMNEIEADQSGTVAEILVEDGKPVSVDTPLFVIVP